MSDGQLQAPYLTPCCQYLASCWLTEGRWQGNVAEFSQS